MKNNVIAELDFDSNIFKKPCYRITSENFEYIQSTLLEYKFKKNIFIDAKVNAANKFLDIYLKRFGFHKVCMQVRLIFDINKNLSNSKPQFSTKSVSLSEEKIRQHCDNFYYDRFSLDPRISKVDRDNLYTSWIRNSLSNESIIKAAIDENFISFKPDGHILKLDLSSVLNQGKGIGTLLLSDVVAYGAENNFKQVSVLTETENISAVKFYLQNGFRLDSFYSCFHYIS
jgi:hypothetical protein